MPYSTPPTKSTAGEYGRNRSHPPRNATVIACGPKSSPLKFIRVHPGSFVANLLANHVRPVLLVFDTTRIEQFRVRRQVMSHRDRKRRGVSLRIVNRDLNFHPPEAHAPEPLRHLRRVRHGSPIAVEPQPIAKPDGMDHQRVAFPLS